MFRSGIIIVMIILIALAIGYAYFQPEWPGTSSAPTTSDTAPLKVIHPRSTGRIEPASGVIEVTATMGDRIVWLDERLKPASRDSQSDSKQSPVVVTAGELLARMESYELKSLEIEAVQSQIAEAENVLTAEKSAAQAKVEAVEAEMKIAESSVDDIALQQEKIEIAQSNLDLAQLALDNLNQLKQADAELVNESELKRQTLLVEQASAQVKAEQSMLEKARTSSTNAIASATAALTAAKAALRVVEAGNSIDTLNKQIELLTRQRNLGEVRAPRDGMVLKVYVHEGETIGRMPVCLLANLNSIVVVAEVNETEVQHIDFAAPVKITSAAFGEKSVRGMIQSRDWIVAEAGMSGPGAFAAKDRRVIEYRILVDEDDVPLVRDFIQLEVDVIFNQAVDEESTEEPSAADEAPADEPSTEDPTSDEKANGDESNGGEADVSNAPARHSREGGNLVERVSSPIRFVAMSKAPFEAVSHAGQLGSRLRGNDGTIGAKDGSGT